MKCHLFTECGKISAIFGFNKEDKIRYCKAHKQPGMIDLKNKKCVSDGCTSQPSYNNIDQTVALYCNTHKQPGMVDVKNKKCAAVGCLTQPRYNNIGSTKAKYCKAHKLHEMIDIYSHRCEYAYCNTSASYNTPGSSYVKFCVKHKDPEMVEIYAKLCEYNGCNTRAAYNVSGSTSCRFCARHKEPNMIELYAIICEYEGCEIRASYKGEDDKIRKFCAKHKDTGMISCTSIYCHIDGCTTIASFGDKDSKLPKFCKIHKDQNMTTKTNRMCIKCDQVSARQVYKYHCYSCYLTIYPDAIRKIKNHKIKENAIMNKVKDIYPDIILDKLIDGASSNRRPDGIIYLESHIIIVEVDEYQHKYYEPGYDTSRVNEIIEDLNDRPIVFVRINPDSYKRGILHVSSAFKKCPSTGLLITDEAELDIRVSYLLDTLKYHYSFVPKERLTVEYLFFDETII